MRRTLVAVGLVAASLALFRTGLLACGDKSLGAGGIRFDRGLYQKFPASILIYSQPNSRIGAAARKLNLQQALEEAGHKYREVTTKAEFERELASGAFNVIMADVAETPAVQQSMGTMPKRPAIVAVAYKLTKTEAKDAKKERFLVKETDLKVVYLDKIIKAARSKT